MRFNFIFIIRKKFKMNMSIKKFVLFILLICESGLSFSQQKILSMEDAMVNSRTSLAPKTLKQLQFIKGSSDFVFVRNINNEDVWVRGNVKDIEGQPYLSLSKINSKLKAALLDTLKALPNVQFNNDNYTLSLKGKKYSFNNDKDEFKFIGNLNTIGKENIDESSAGYFAYTDSFNLFVTKDGVVKQVTTDGTRNIVYGQSVHQQEFGITKGTFWDNSGKNLAFYRMDQTMVPDYPIIDWSVRPAKVNNIKYPMAGDKSHHVTLGIYNEAGNVIYIKTGLPEEQYLTNIAWAPDNKSIYIAVEDRSQKHMKLNQYDVATGDFIKTLFEESDDKYVEPLVPILFLKNDPSKFIWQSRRNGWTHLYLYNTNGKLLKQLTNGPWEVLEVKGFNGKGDELFYVSTAVSPLSRNLYRLNLYNAKSKAVTSGDFVHNTSISSSGEFIIDNFSSPVNPRTILLTEVKNGKSIKLLQADNPLADYKLGELSMFKLKSDDDFDLYARMYKPINFDSTKKYPVIVYWYGGPHAQIILNSWNGGSGDYWFQYLAERGYIVFSLDTRGSANRGREFEQKIFRHAGKVQMEDMMKGVDYLSKLGYADTSRMGLFGWSYGGFMTTSFLLNHPGVFKAGVAGGPVINWRFYEIMYTERYMDSPELNAEGYAETDLTKKVGNLKDKLLLIHGLQDPVVVQQHSVNFVKAAVDKGIQVDYMIYPGHEHNVLGKDRVHLYQKVTDYFKQNL